MSHATVTQRDEIEAGTRRSRHQLQSAIELGERRRQPSRAPVAQCDVLQRERSARGVAEAFEFARGLREVWNGGLEAALVQIGQSHVVDLQRAVISLVTARVELGEMKEGYDRAL